MPHSLAALNSCDREAFVAALGHVFEHSPWVADGAFGRRPFTGAEGLHKALCETMFGAPAERKLALVRSHPDLAGRLARAGELTASSAREQAAAGLDRLDAAETAEIERLNGAYKARFGFPFVICARENTKESILAALAARRANDRTTEIATALAEIAKIARLRIEDALS